MRRANMMHPYQYPGLHDKFQHLALSRSWPQLTARNAPATKIGMRTSVLGAVLCLVACGGSSSSGAPAQAAAISPLAGNYSTHGFSIDRPDGWMFVTPDASVA